MLNVKSEKLQKAILVTGILTGVVILGGDYEMQWKLNAGIRYAF